MMLLQQGTQKNILLTHPKEGISRLLNKLYLSFLKTYVMLIKKSNIHFSCTTYFSEFFF